MKKISVKVEGQVIVEYNFELFEKHIDEICIKAMCEVGATIASKEQIVLNSYSDLSKLNNLMISYLMN